jgi:hypothetical protein
MSNKRDRSDDSSDDCPWKSDDSEDQRALLGKRSKVFVINDEGYVEVVDLREELLAFATKVERVVDTAGWDAGAVFNVINNIYEYIDDNCDNYQGYLLSGLINRDGSMGVELLLSKEVRDVSFFI